MHGSNILSGKKRPHDTSIDAAHRTAIAAHTIGAPRLAAPFWYRQAHSGIWTSEKEINACMSAAAAKVYKRKRAKAARQAARSATMSQARARSLANLAA